MTRKADPQTTRQIAPRTQLPDFTPVPRQGKRHDGWTEERQHRFIEALADTGSISAACKAVDMSTVGAYQLRRQQGADSFREAWAAALDLGVQRLEDIAMERALNGVEEPFYAYGNLIGTRRKYNDRLLMFMLRNRAPERFGNSLTKGGGSLKGLNAVGRMEKKRLKAKWRRKWRKQWEKEQSAKGRGVSPAEVRASLDAKIDGLRREHELRWQREWEELSQDTRAAWERFVELRDADFEQLAADEEKRRRLALGPRETVNLEPFDWRKKPEPKARKTRWTLKDDGWD